MNPTTSLRQAARSIPSSSYPPTKSTGRQLSSQTLRSLISLHHSSAGFMHNPQVDLPVGFDNTFRYTRDEPKYKRYGEFSSTTSYNASLTPPGGLESLVEKPRSAEARGLEFRKGRNNYLDLDTAKNVGLTFKKVYDIWSDRGSGSDTQHLTERELRVQEALYGTWERGSQGMNSRIQPSLDGILEFVEAKGKTVGEYAEEWKVRDREGREKSTEDGQ
ncbi:hypothetical protein V866_008041 [Kwoniella sp. B9012]